MSSNLDDIRARLRQSIPGFGAEQGSQTLRQLATRNNISSNAIKIYAEAAKRADAQAREFAKFQRQQLELQAEQEQLRANVERESASLVELATNTVGDERTRRVLAENGTLSSQVQQTLQAQLQNLQASGEHVDENGNLTFQAQALGGALARAGQQADADLQRTFGGDEGARQNATRDAQDGLSAGGIENFLRSSGASIGRGVAGLALQPVAALAGDTAVGRFAGRAAAGVDRLADRVDVVTPEEAAFNQEFGESDGFVDALGTILNNPGQALQAFGPSVVGAVGGGGIAGAAARRAVPALTGRLAQNAATRQAGRTGRLGAAANRVEQSATGAAPAVFAGGGASFVEGADDALNSETDDIGSFARRGLATSAVGTAAAGLVGGAGLATLDDPFRRFRQASATPLAQAEGGVLRRTGRFGRVVGGEVGRGAAGEGIQEGIEGAAQDISAQVGEGTSLAELDLSRTQRAAGQSIAAGVSLGGAASLGTGTVSTLRRKQESELRTELAAANGRENPEGVAVPREALANLDLGQIDRVLAQWSVQTPETHEAFVRAVAQDLGVESLDITPDQASALFRQSQNAEGRVTGDLFRDALGNLIGVPLTVNGAGQVERAADPDTAASGIETPVADRFGNLPNININADDLPNININADDPLLDPNSRPNIRIDADEAVENNLPNININADDPILDPGSQPNIVIDADVDPNAPPIPGVGQNINIDADDTTAASLNASAETLADPVQGSVDPTVPADTLTPDQGAAPAAAPAPTPETPPASLDVDAQFPGNSEQQTADPAASNPEGVTGVVGELTDSLLDPEIEATIGDVPNVSAAIRDNDGSPQGQAAIDFQSALVRNQIARGDRQPGDLTPSVQLEITNRLEREAADRGLTDPAERSEFFRTERERVANEVRAFRDAEIARRAGTFQPQPAPTPVDPLPAQPAETPSVDASQRPATFARDVGELNIITEGAADGTVVIPQALRTQLLGASAPSTERRGLQGLPESDKEAIRSQYVKADDLINPDSLADVRRRLDALRKDVLSVFRVGTKGFGQGDGVAELKNKGTEETRAAAVESLRKRIPEELAAIQALMTPEGYQRVFGKKL